MCVAFGTVINCFSDFYKKLQDRHLIIPIKIKVETDSKTGMLYNYSVVSLLIYEIDFLE